MFSFSVSNDGGIASFMVNDKVINVNLVTCATIVIFMLFKEEYK